MANSKPRQPATVGDVAPSRMALRDWINQVYLGRHGFTEKRKWPLLEGGSFIEVVQRVWSDEGNLLQDSLDLVKKLGIMDGSASLEDFENKYLVMQDL